MISRGAKRTAKIHLLQSQLVEAQKSAGYNKYVSAFVHAQSVEIQAENKRLIWEMELCSRCARKVKR